MAAIGSPKRQLKLLDVGIMRLRVAVCDSVSPGVFVAVRRLPNNGGKAGAPGEI